MKEELQTKLVEILGSIQTAAGKAGDFAMTQLPDIAQQYVTYGRIFVFIDLLVVATVVAALLYLMRWAYKNPWKGDLDEPRGPSNILVQVLSGAGAFIFVCLFMSALRGAVLVWFAPKVWLLKEIATLIK
jgi:hypothetical protein